MPKGVRKDEPHKMLDQVAETAHRREVDALLDRAVGNGPWAEMDNLEGLRQKVRQALVGGTSRGGKQRIKPLASEGRRRKPGQ